MTTAAGAGKRPLVKICGVTRPEAALRAVTLGADLVGLNFWPGSPRYLELEAAREIAGAIRGRALIVGVFVNTPADRIQQIRDAVGVDLVQLHGDEAPAQVRRLGERAIKAVRLDPARPSFQAELYPEVWGFVVEARRRGEYGGTGAPWEYGAIRGLISGKPVLVAGGVRPETARQALAQSGAAGIDVCSGVESAPGVQDPARLEELFRRVRGARSEDGSE